MRRGWQWHCPFPSGSPIPDTSVLQAIATAGGLTEWAKKDDIVILRNGPEGDFWIEFDYEKLVSGKDIGQNILLKPGDVIVVP